MTTYNTRRKRVFRCLFALVTVTTLAVPYIALGVVMLSGTQGLSDRARRGNSLFHNEMAASLVLLSETQGPSDRTRTGNIPFPIVLTALDFFVGMDSTILVGMDSTPVFSRFNLHQAATGTHRNRIYVQPRWVNGGYEVQVSQPGYWAVPK